MLTFSSEISQETRSNTVKFIVAAKKQQWDTCRSLIPNIDFLVLYNGESIGAILVSNQSPYDLFDLAVLQPIAKTCAIHNDSSIMESEGATFDEGAMLTQRLQTAMLRVLLEREDFISATAYLTRLTIEIKDAEINRTLGELNHLDQEKLARITRFCEQFLERSRVGIISQSSVESMGSNTTVTPPSTPTPGASSSEIRTVGEVAKPTDPLHTSQDQVGIIIASSTATPAPSPVPALSRQQSEEKKGEEEGEMHSINPLDLLDSYFLTPSRAAVNSDSAVRAETVVQQGGSIDPVFSSALGISNQPEIRHMITGAAAVADRHLDDDWVVVASRGESDAERVRI